MWREQRRFTFRHLKDFGFGRAAQEVMMRDEIVELMADIDRHSNPTPLLDEFLNPEPASETDDRSRTR